MNPGSAVRPERPGRHVEIETPENVTLRLELAGIGSRALAAFFDTIVLGLILIVITIVAPFIAVATRSTWVGAVLIIAWVVVIWGYFALFEAVGNGRTPGKRRLGLRVVMDTGHPITVQAALIRNLIRMIDLQPGITGFVGMGFMLFHPQGKRLGDLLAGTIVVRDEAAELKAIAPVFEEAAGKAVPATLAATSRLTDEEYRLIEQFLTREDELPATVRDRFRHDLAGRLADRFPDHDTSRPRFLRDAFDAERRARQAPGASRREGGGTRLRVADRFVALRQARWETFRRRAAGLERTGLAGLGGEEVLTFAGDYRAVAADLARAITYGVDDRTVAQLEGVVGAGHNAIYGARKGRRDQSREFFLRQLPAAALRQSRYVIAAALLLLLPGLISYTVIRERPTVAREVLPTNVLDYASRGQANRAAGSGYQEHPSMFLPLLASSLIANNVQVAFVAFIGGVTAGTLTILILVSNGLSLGAMLGHYTNLGLAGWLLTFVAGHGVLELTAIFIAGGAGLLIGRTIVAPGDLARRDALVLSGREALRMLGAAAALLILAGTIEGLLSASDAPAELKVAVSLSSALLLVLLVVAGYGKGGQEEAGWSASVGPPVLTPPPATPSRTSPASPPPTRPP